MADLQPTVCSSEDRALYRPKHCDCGGGVLARRNPPNAENHYFDLCRDPRCSPASQLNRTLSPVRKISRPNTGAIHEKENLECDCGSLDRSSYHSEWSTKLTVSLSPRSKCWRCSPPPKSSSSSASVGNAQWKASRRAAVRDPGAHQYKDAPRAHDA